MVKCGVLFEVRTEFLNIILVGWLVRLQRVNFIRPAKGSGVAQWVVVCTDGVTHKRTPVYHLRAVLC
jgi:hypothetical protein